MINVIDLENRWVKYKIKSYIPHAVIVSSLIIILILSLLISTDDEKTIQTNDINISTKTKPLIEQEIRKEPAKPTKSIEPKSQKKEEFRKNETIEIKKNKTPEIKKKMILSPSLDFIRDMQNDTLPYYESENATTETTAKNETKVTAQKNEIKVKSLSTPVKTKTSSISISRQDTQEDINQVIKRFKVNNSPALSLFIAKKYYELGQYNKSYNYALITNGINSNIESSWIIFAKSLVKLNEKEMAIKTLKTYYDHSGSNKAKILLDEIITGKFK